MVKETPRLRNISPIDGRYGRKTESLADYFSEMGLQKHRAIMECEYLIKLSETPSLDIREFAPEEKKLIRSLYQDFTLEDAQIIKDFEVRGYDGIPATNHDVKAVEYFIKYKLKNTSLEDCLEWIHFALTSEDATNIAHALMIRNGLDKVVIPKLDEVHQSIENFAQDNKGLPVLARTHGQPASPITFGKAGKTFAYRLKRQLNQLKKYQPLAKLNGATGCYNAHAAAYPKVNWIKFSEDFITGLHDKIEVNYVTDQIEPHDTIDELGSIMRRINKILIKLDRDFWRYISDEWIVQIPKEGEVGSSTMPHKVNPIDIEGSEGNLSAANAMFEFIADYLPMTRLQRDLSDSTVSRNLGTCFGYSMIGYINLLKGLGKYVVNEKKVIKELNKHPEIITEAYQTILRREGIQGAYEQMKGLVRGKKATMAGLQEFIKGLEIKEEVKKELLAITPENYTGLAEKLVEQF